MSMVLQVVQMSGNAICELRVEPTDRIEELEEVVQLKTLNACTLCFNGVQLQHQDVVDRCGLQDGSQVTAIIAANAAQLKNGAFGELCLRNRGKKGFTAQELIDAGHEAPQLKALGFTTSWLKTIGLTALELRALHFNASELKNAGFTLAELKAIQLTCRFCNGTGWKSKFFQCSFCFPSGSGHRSFTTSDLKDAGYGLSEFKAIGFSACQCIAAGFAPAHCMEAWSLHSTKDCKEAGFSAAVCKKAGFSAADCIAVGFSLADCNRAGFSVADCEEAGFSEADCKEAGFSAADCKEAGFSVVDCKKVGFSVEDCKQAGFSAADCKEAGFSMMGCIKAGFSDTECKRAGFPVTYCRCARKKRAGFPVYHFEWECNSPNDTLNRCTRCPCGRFWHWDKHTTCPGCGATKPVAAHLSFLFC